MAGKYRFSSIMIADVNPDSPFNLLCTVKRVYIDYIAFFYSKTINCHCAYNQLYCPCTLDYAILTRHKLYHDIMVITYYINLCIFGRNYIVITVTVGTVIALKVGTSYQCLIVITPQLE